ncbi:Nuclear pore complex nucleoporin component [Coemansia spiralis]|nr:Nuclear pore complex nucleoporin component [Coemansia spiralis]
MSRPDKRRSLGTPFPVASSPVSPRPPPDGAYGTGGRHRELAERAKLRMRCSGPAAEARTSACRAYVSSIQKEAEDARVFLAGLTLAPVPAAPAAGMDPSVADTLAQVDQMRRDFEKRQKEEAAAKETAAKEKAEAAAREQEEAWAKEKAAKEESQRSAEEATAAAARKRAEEELAKTAAMAAVPEQAPAAPVSDLGRQSASAPALEWATKYRRMYREIMDTVAPQIQGNPAIKAACFKQRGLVTRGLGQLKDSWEFVARTADNINAIVTEAARSGPVVERWMLNLVAKAIVKQAEREVSVAHHAAYPLAATAVKIMQSHPQLVDMLMVRLVKKCPYVIPEYIRRQPGQSVTDFMRASGYKENESSELESEGIYMERMAGMLALFAAIVQTAPVGGSPNPFPIRHGWTWLARMLNLAPRTISPLLVQTFLSVAGAAMLAAYPRQLPKLLELASQAWLPAVSSKNAAAVAARSNLAGYLDEYWKTRKLKECAGRVIKAR